MSSKSTSNNLKKYSYESLPIFCLHTIPIKKQSREHFCLAASYISVLSIIPQRNTTI